jgi:hypothetical protein
VNVNIVKQIDKVESSDRNNENEVVGVNSDHDVLIFEIEQEVENLEYP